ncbi:MAG: hypothetical protein VKK59_06985 [Vampirovibrionales bacterium]|nr:hypothetical protein [Vampirovibrionales bacterium]
MRGKFTSNPTDVTAEDILQFNKAQQSLPGPKLILGPTLNPRLPFTSWLLANIPSLETLMYSLKTATKIPLDSAAYFGPVSLVAAPRKQFKALVRQAPQPELLISMLKATPENEIAKKYRLTPEQELSLRSKGPEAWVKENVPTYSKSSQGRLFARARNSWTTVLREQDKIRTLRLRDKIPFSETLPDPTRVLAIKLMGSSAIRPEDVVRRLAQGLGNSRSPLANNQRLIQSAMGNPIDGFIPLDVKRILRDGRFNLGLLIDEAQKAMAPKG